MIWKYKIMIAILIITWSGCIYRNNVIVGPKEFDENIKIHKAVTSSGDDFIFNESGARLEYTENAVYGCLNSKIIKFKPDEIVEYRTRMQFETSISRSAGHTIYEARTLNREITTFDDKGAVIDSVNKVLVGNDIHGREISIPFNKVVAINLKKPDTVSLAELKNNNSIRIKQAVLKNRIIVTFDGAGGLYVEEGTVLAGISNINELIVLNSENVHSIQRETINPGLSFFSTIGVMGCGVILLGLFWLAGH